MKMKTQSDYIIYLDPQLPVSPSRVEPTAAVRWTLLIWKTGRECGCEHSSRCGQFRSRYDPDIPVTLQRSQDLCCPLGGGGAARVDSEPGTKLCWRWPHAIASRPRDKTEIPISILPQPARSIPDWRLRRGTHISNLLVNTHLSRCDSLLTPSQSKLVFTSSFKNLCTSLQNLLRVLEMSIQ